MKEPSHFYPRYVDLNKGESVSLPGLPRITLLGKQIVLRDETLNRIAESAVHVKVGARKVTVPVGLEHESVAVGDVCVGGELTLDYPKDFPNERLRLTKAARLRISKRGVPLLPPDKYGYPFDMPWNNGARSQAWLAVCYSLARIEGDPAGKIGRYHDGYDIGVWEGLTVRSVCRGKVARARAYKACVECGLMRPNVGTKREPHSLLIEDLERPLLFYYGHLSGCARTFRAGDTIEKGEVCAYTSIRGASGGWYHLHLTILDLAQRVRVNPFPFLREWYLNTLPHYADFLTDFAVHVSSERWNNQAYDRMAFVNKVVAGRAKPIRRYRASVPGCIYLRDAISPAPVANIRENEHQPFLVLASEFRSRVGTGELWLGHTGKVTAILNGKLVYSGENKTPYERHVRPMQPDSVMIKCRYRKGRNRLVLACERTNVFGVLSVRPRDAYGCPM